jgi:serine/threonine-protein kinase
LQSEYQFLGPAFSPDGHWIAYTSNVSGQMEVYVQSYPELGERHLISSAGGSEPLWAHSGREIFYRQDDRYMAVDVATTPRFSASKARLLFTGSYVTDTPVRSYDLSLDDKRFLMVRINPGQEPAATRINIVLNWTEEVRKR